MLTRPEHNTSRAQHGDAPTAPSNRRFACGKMGGAFRATRGQLEHISTDFISEYLL